MNGRLILGFAIGVVAASAVAYVTMEPSRPAPLVVPSVLSDPSTNSAASAPQNVSDPPAEQKVNPEPAPTDPLSTDTQTSASDPASKASAPVQTHAQSSPPAPVVTQPTRLKPFTEYRADARQVEARETVQLKQPTPPRSESRPIEADVKGVTKYEPWTPVTPPPNSTASPAVTSSTEQPTAPQSASPQSTNPQSTTSTSEWHTLSSPPNPPTASQAAEDVTSTQRVSGVPRSSPISTPPANQVATLRRERLADVITPPASRQPSTVTLLAGTQLSIRLDEGLTSKRNHVGDSFFASLDQPLVIDGMVIAERGARVEGQVAVAQNAGRARGAAQLTIELTQLHASDGQVVPIHTAPYAKQGGKRASGIAEKVGGGAAIGAIIGAVGGGGVGAAIGAGVGGVAGGGAAIVTRGKPVALPVETLLTFRIDQPVTITEQLR